MPGAAARDRSLKAIRIELEFLVDSGFMKNAQKEQIGKILPAMPVSQTPRPTFPFPLWLSFFGKQQNASNRPFSAGSDTGNETGVNTGGDAGAGSSSDEYGNEISDGSDGRPATDNFPSAIAQAAQNPDHPAHPKHPKVRIYCNSFEQAKTVLITARSIQSGRRRWDGNLGAPPFLVLGPRQARNWR